MEIEEMLEMFPGGNELADDTKDRLEELFEQIQDLEPGTTRKVVEGVSAVVGSLAIMAYIQNERDKIWKTVNAIMKHVVETEEGVVQRYRELMNKALAQVE